MIEIRLAQKAYDFMHEITSSLNEVVYAELQNEKRVQPRATAFAEMPDDIEDGETLEQAKARIAIRYDALDRLSTKVVNGKIPSLIASGPAGLGKTYTLDKALKATGRRRYEPADIFESAPVDASSLYDRISGGISAPGLYQALWNMRNGGVILFDESDSMFYDPDARNLLKIATDTSEVRLLSWRKQADWLHAYKVDRTFEFRGHIGFLTNMDFEKLVEKPSKDTEHFKALIDRSRYLCLTVRTQRDFMIRIRHVALEEGMLARRGLSDSAAVELIDYIDAHRNKFYNLSLRLVGHIADDMREDPENWRGNIEATKMRTQKC